MGGPVITTPPENQGFGSVLTQRCIADQLGGKIEYDWQETGLNAVIDIPLEMLSA
jgi:two-component sensor histidine kinase